MKIVEDILTEDFPDYNIYMEILNTKDFNKPQNRNRFFLVMIKKTLDLGFKFPKKQALTTKFTDLLEDKVNESLTITDREIIVYPHREYNNPTQLHLYGETKNKNGKKSVHRSSRTILFPHMCSCLTTHGHTKIYHQNIVRNLSPREQIRLHGGSEEYILPTDNYNLCCHIMGNTLSPVVMKGLIENVLFMDNTKVNNISFNNESLLLVS